MPFTKLTGPTGAFTSIFTNIMTLSITSKKRPVFQVKDLKKFNDELADALAYVKDNNKWPKDGQVTTSFVQMLENLKSLRDHLANLDLKTLKEAAGELTPPEDKILRDLIAKIEALKEQANVDAFNANVDALNKLLASYGQKIAEKQAEIAEVVRQLNLLTSGIPDEDKKRDLISQKGILTGELDAVKKAWPTLMTTLQGLVIKVVPKELIEAVDEDTRKFKEQPKPVKKSFAAVASLAPAAVIEDSRNAAFITRREKVAGKADKQVAAGVRENKTDFDAMKAAGAAKLKSVLEQGAGTKGSKLGKDVPGATGKLVFSSRAQAQHQEDLEWYVKADLRIIKRQDPATGKTIDDYVIGASAKVIFSDYGDRIIVNKDAVNILDPVAAADAMISGDLTQQAKVIASFVSELERERSAKIGSEYNPYFRIVSLVEEDTGKPFPINVNDPDQAEALISLARRVIDAGRIPYLDEKSRKCIENLAKTNANAKNMIEILKIAYGEKMDVPYNDVTDHENVIKLIKAKNAELFSSAAAEEANRITGGSAPFVQPTIKLTTKTIPTAVIGATISQTINNVTTQVSVVPTDLEHAKALVLKVQEALKTQHIPVPEANVVECIENLSTASVGPGVTQQDIDAAAAAVKVLKTLATTSPDKVTGKEFNAVLAQAKTDGLITTAKRVDETAGTPTEMNRRNPESPTPPPVPPFMSIKPTVTPLSPAEEKQIQDAIIANQTYVAGEIGVEFKLDDAKLLATAAIEDINKALNKPGADRTQVIEFECLRLGIPIPTTPVTPPKPTTEPIKSSVSNEGVAKREEINVGSDVRLAGAAKLSRPDEIDMNKYLKMLKAGLPKGAVQNGMRRDNVDEAEIRKLDAENIDMNALEAEWKSKPSDTGGSRLRV